MHSYPVTPRSSPQSTHACIYTAERGLTAAHRATNHMISEQDRWRLTVPPWPSISHIQGVGECVCYRRRLPPASRDVSPAGSPHLLCPCGVPSLPSHLPTFPLTSSSRRGSCAGGRPKQGLLTHGQGPRGHCSLEAHVQLPRGKGAGRGAHREGLHEQGCQHSGQLGALGAGDGEQQGC